MPNGKIEPLSPEALEQGIQMRRVLPWDQISNNGRDFEAFPFLEIVDPTAIEET